MGLTIHYELRLCADTPPWEVDEKLAELRDYASTLAVEYVSPFASVDLLDGDATGTERYVESASFILYWGEVFSEPFEKSERRVGDPTSVRGFRVDPGEGCETATFGLLLRAEPDGAKREWYWWCACKTQYASNVSEEHFVACHSAVVAILDYAIGLGIQVSVHDETEYWETRNMDRLIEELGRMNRVIAAFAGKLSDAFGEGRRIEAPIFGHPKFERLEMGE